MAWKYVLVILSGLAGCPDHSWAAGMVLSTALLEPQFSVEGWADFVIAVLMQWEPHFLMVRICCPWWGPGMVLVRKIPQAEAIYSCSCTNTCGQKDWWPAVLNLQEAMRLSDNTAFSFKHSISNDVPKAAWWFYTAMWHLVLCAHHGWLAIVLLPHLWSGITQRSKPWSIEGFEDCWKLQN